MPIEIKVVNELIRAKGIGARIRKLRQSRDLNLEEAGRRTGLSSSYLSQVETGRIVPTLQNLARFSLVYGKDMAYFLREDVTVNRTPAQVLIDRIACAQDKLAGMLTLARELLEPKEDEVTKCSI
jgi:transcriptional regulator with XRE-family HTH domain